MSGLDVEPVDADEEADTDNTIEVTPTESVDDEAATTDEVDQRIDVEVEPTDEVDGPDYVLYGGKGGVGKTTMAAATALDSARSGIRTLVISTDPAHSLSDAFEMDVPSQPERLREDVPLFGVEIDPEAAMAAGETAFGGAGGPAGGERDGSAGATDGEAFGDGEESVHDESDPFSGDQSDSFSEGEGRPFGGGEGNPFSGGEGGPFGGGEGGPLGGMGELLGGENPMESMFGGAMPGADEAAAMQLLLKYLDDERFDRVVVDTAPTGHTLRLLELPDVMETMVGRILTVRQRIGNMIEGIKGMFGGASDAGFDVDDLHDLSDRIRRLRSALRDPERTDFRIVMVPEEMSVLESTRLREQLDSVGIPVGTVVVNRVMEPLADVTDEVDGDFLSPDLDDCAFCQRRWDVQQTALREAQDLFRGTDVRRVPLFADEVRGEAMLSVVAACLR